MNIFEKYGSYEVVRQAAENYKKSGDRVTAAGLELQCLEYRRQHNIYEVGDKVVHPKFSNMNIYEICEIKGDLFTVFYERKSHSFKSDVRHATNAEIKAGKRL